MGIAEEVATETGATPLRTKFWGGEDEHGELASLAGLNDWGFNE